MPKNKRIVVSLDDSAAEALSELSGWLGLGEDALARRILSAILNVIAGAMESKPNLNTPEAQVSPLGEGGELEAFRLRETAEFPSSESDMP